MPTWISKYLRILVLTTVTLCAPAFVEAGSVTWQRGSAPQRDAAPDFGLGFSGRLTRAGILITHVDPRGSAQGIGLEVGDVLLSVNHQPLQSLDGWIQAMSDGNGRFHFRIRDVNTGNVVIRTLEFNP